MNDFTATAAVDLDADFGIDDLDLSSLSIVSMMDSAALPETGASYKSSSCCVVAA